MMLHLDLGVADSEPFVATVDVDGNGGVALLSDRAHVSDGGRVRRGRFT